MSADHLAGIDCAVVEFGLPDASGPQLLERLAELADDLPVVVLTAQADDDTTAAAFRHGAQECLVKQSADGRLIDRAVHCAVIRKRLRSAADERMSRDLALHDHVIQQLFAIGMAMQTTELRSAQPEVAKRIADHLDGLHAVVQEMRAALQDVAVGTRAGRQGTGSGGRDRAAGRRHSGWPARNAVMLVPPPMAAAIRPPPERARNRQSCHACPPDSPAT